MSAATDYLDKTSDPFIECDAWCQTENVEWSASTPYTFVWTIKRFSARDNNIGDSIESSSFIVPVPSCASLTTEWKLFLTYEKDFLSVALSYHSDLEVKAKYKFSILNSNKSRQNFLLSKGAETFDQYTNTEGEGKRFAKRNLHGDMLPDGCLHIVCDLALLAADITLSSPSKLKAKDSDESSNVHENQLSFDLQVAFTKNDSCTSDMVIKCGEKVFNCHKFILKARSPVFNAMLQANMKESNSGEVNIDNLTPTILEGMLHFIYTGKTPNIDDLAKDLLVAADQYQLVQLKKTCEENLCQTLGIGNCIEFLFYADTHSAKLLRKMSLEMAAKNLSVLMKTSEWKKDLLDYPLLKDEIMESALVSKVDQWLKT